MSTRFITTTQKQMLSPPSYVNSVFLPIPIHTYTHTHVHMYTHTRVKHGKQQYTSCSEHFKNAHIVLAHHKPRCIGAYMYYGSGMRAILSVAYF